MNPYSQNIEWLKSKAGYLKIDRIEKKLKIPQGTLKKFVDGKRGLPENWHQQVSAWVEAFWQTIKTEKMTTSNNTYDK